MADAAKPKEEKSTRVLILRGKGGYDKVKLEKRAWPSAGEGQVVVHVKACGVNFVDLMIRQGVFDVSAGPCVMGIEAAGVVTEVGAGVTDREIGDRVIAFRHIGMWRDAIAIEATKTLIMPDNMTFEEGAAFLVNYFTAYLLLFEQGNLRNGKTVLVHAAAGGTGIAAVQLCRTVENVTIFGTASASKHDFLKEAGVTHPIDYRTKDYEAEIRQISPEGVDIVLDPLSGADSAKCYSLLKPLGKIIHYGAYNTVTGEKRDLVAVLKARWRKISYTWRSLIVDNKSVAGISIENLMDDVNLMKAVMTELFDLFRQEKIKPKIDSVWSFEEVGKAMTRLHERTNIGKVILSPEAKPTAESSSHPEKSREEPGTKIASSPEKTGAEPGTTTTGQIAAPEVKPDTTAATTQPGGAEVTSSQTTEGKSDSAADPKDGKVESPSQPEAEVKTDTPT